MNNPYRDRSLTIEQRVEDLLGRLSVAEKMGQLALPLGWEAWERRNGRIEVSDLFRPLIGGDGLGMLYGTLRTDPWTGRTFETGLTPREGAETLNLLQRLAVEGTRWGIPLLFTEDCAQGMMTVGSSQFPPGLTLSCTWNEALAERVARAIAAEARCRGVTVAIATILDLARDPRWSRVEETLGEDPYLAGQLGGAMVRAFQTGQPGQPLPMAATIKHFAAHGDPEGGHNIAPAHVGTRELHEILLAPFRTAVRQTGALAVMSSYNEIDGEPCSGSRRLLTDILRTEWGFTGLVMSDCYSVEGLVGHGLAADVQAAGALAVNAGLDSVMTDIVAFQKMQLAAAAQSGQLRREDLDESVRRILRLKFALGLFENPYVDEGRPAEIVGCREHAAIARQVAREGIVLLKNANNILPLKKELSTVAVIGPNADSPFNHFGHYAGPQVRSRITTALEGIRAAVAPQTVVRYARGCGIRDESRAGFAEAVTAATGADVALVVVGGSSARQYGQQHSETGAAIAGTASETECGEGHDRSELGLPGVQLDLLRALHATGTPLVVVYIAGRPLSMEWASEHAAGLLAAWYPGEQGGGAIADVLFGDYNPAGRLTVSVPRSVGQLPVYYNHKRTSRRDYTAETCQPRFPFGYGLSYTTFQYADLRIEPATIPAAGQATISVAVTNTGHRAGDEVVQLYITDPLASVTRPVRELKGFRRIHLAPGATQRVSLDLPAEELRLLNPAGQWVVEPGEIEIAVGGNQTDVLKGVLTIASRAPDRA